MTLNVFIQVFLITIFGVSGVGKLLHRSNFVHTLNQLQLSKWMPPVLSVLVPLGELLVCLCLLIPTAQVLGYGITLLLSMSFIWAGIRGIGAKKQVDCHCFGQFLEEKLGWNTLVKAILLIVVSAYSLWSHEAANLFLIDWLEVTCAIFVSIAVIMLYALYGQLKLNRQG